MVGRGGVTINADVPIVGATGAGANSGLRQRRNQLDRGLQARCCWNGARGDSERPVLPKDVVFHQRVRELRAVRIVFAALHGGIGERRQQGCVVHFRLQSCREEVGLSDDAVRAIVGRARR